MIRCFHRPALLLMNPAMLIAGFMALCAPGASEGAAAAVPAGSLPEARSFIGEMVTRHGFGKAELDGLFQQALIQEAILEAISKPWEAKPWYRYRAIFLNEERIRLGAEFWRRHADTLHQLEQRHGVPARILVAILGVETRFGTVPGKHRVIDALSTLAFAYPKRAAFFRKELEQYLLLCREEGISPLEPKGSYAGAMGLPQFMPSSFRAYAADHTGDGRRDIWNDPADSLASVANYFTRHGWKSGEPIAVQVQVRAGSAVSGSRSGKPEKPQTPAGKLLGPGMTTSLPVPAASPASLYAFVEEQGESYWLGFHNFYVITRYNHSPLYALAVTQLGEAIASRLQADGPAAAPPPAATPPPRRTTLH